MTKAQLVAWFLVAGAAVLAGAVTLWLTRATRAVLRERLRRWTRRTIRDFQSRVSRYRLASRKAVQEELLRDPRVLEAMRSHMETARIPELEVRVRVERYLDEIVPFFSVLSYYRLGYNLARLLLNMLYRVSIDYRDRGAIARIPKKDVVVYLMNHRSNADYVLVAYVLARGVAVSYAVGEWARVWPLDVMFRSFGSYFVRRGYREELYHTVLERYVQLTTRNGVTQGIFIEGGLSRDGRLRHARIGLLDYISGTLRGSTAAPGRGRDIWFVPVAISYDRVLEDRVLIRENLDPSLRPGRLAGVLATLHYLAWNTLRLLTGKIRRYGLAAVSFGEPLSLEDWLLSQRDNILDLPRGERLPHIQRLADSMLERIGAVMPVTPVGLASAALLSFDRDTMERGEVLARMGDYRDHLLESGACVVQGEQPVADIWQTALLTLRMRRTVIETGARVVVLARQRPLLEYYANSIRHLLPSGVIPEGQLFSPAQQVGGIETIYRLAPGRP
jgi:glycerol-3-phosphate O-acyltransferase